MRPITHSTHPGSHSAGLSAFTLIEISIVLVIIGLIVGGIVTGQTLIRGAQVRSQLQQIQQYNSAVNTFRDKYGGLPGDLSIPLANQFGFSVPTTCTGLQGGRDGNGLIDGYPTPQQYAAVTGENMLFWGDLGVAHLVEGTFSGSYWYTYFAVCNSSPTTTGNQLDMILPTGKMGDGTHLHVYETNGANWYMLAQIHDLSGVTGALSASANIPVITAYNLDSKVDDGIATTGNVQAMYINGSQSAVSQANPEATDSATSCYNTSNNRYSITVNAGANINCAVSFRFQ